MPYPNPADIEAMKADANLTVMQQEGLNVGYLAYNTTMAPFDNPKVRKALNMAVIKQAITRGLPGNRQDCQEPDPADDVVL
jgi:dipeptide transport system substrate-binding protein